MFCDRCGKNTHEDCGDGFAAPWALPITIQPRNPLLPECPHCKGGHEGWQCPARSFEDRALAVLGSIADSLERLAKEFAK